MIENLVQNIKRSYLCKKRQKKPDAKNGQIFSAQKTNAKQCLNLPYTVTNTFPTHFRHLRKSQAHAKTAVGFDPPGSRQKVLTEARKDKGRNTKPRN
jgi:hypothetical protein